MKSAPDHYVDNAGCIYSVANNFVDNSFSYVDSSMYNYFGVEINNMHKEGGHYWVTSAGNKSEPYMVHMTDIMGKGKASLARR